ncbi:MAG: ABC transporter permease [Clostridia bacterium]
MKILNELTLKNLKLNKKRTTVTIFGIILSVALICSITTFVSSFQNALLNRTKTVDGNFHILLENASKSDIEGITNKSQIKQIAYAEDIGYAPLNSSRNPNKPYIFIQAADENYLNNMGIRILEGRLPQNSQELLIPEHIKTNAGLSLKVGDSITLDMR